TTSPGCLASFQPCPQSRHSRLSGSTADSSSLRPPRTGLGPGRSGEKQPSLTGAKHNRWHTAGLYHSSLLVASEENTTFVYPTRSLTKLHIAHLLASYAFTTN
ncbi:unnamed protein product, partial [Protopolystoma xenopodis]